ncbi:MAG: B-box zinc finger protein [Acidobacteriota bacterium]|nr:B-box zinc finger protein [Acidobacteriota bacterium]
MTCANHPDAAAAAYCRTCGKPLCALCKIEAEGTIFCAEHVPVADTPLGTAPPQQAPGANAGAPSETPLYSSPYSATANPAGSGPVPGLALVLGLIPGVGAIYNGQYAKGLIHAVVFGIFISVLNSHSARGLEPLVAILLAAWVFYMAFEAYHTAKRRREGSRVDEFSSLVELDRGSGRFPVGAVVLIAIGGLLLLDTTNVIPLERLIHLWPLGLILIGAYMLYERMSPAARTSREAGDERR